MDINFKMKVSIAFLLLLDIPPLKGQQKIEESEHILLRFAFPSFYNTYNKSCCKLYPGGCYKLLDSAGFTCDFLRGRVTKTEMDGWIEFKISNVQFVDGGYYRCIVLGAQNRIYRDFYIEVSEASQYHRQSQLPTLGTVAKTPSTSTVIPGTSVPALVPDHSDGPRLRWSLGLPVAVIVSITVMLLIASVIGVVCLRVKAKPKHLDKYGETLHDSPKQEAPDSGGLVYTTVDFQAQQKSTELYVNLGLYKPQAGEPDRRWSTAHAGMVEYSTLAVHQ